ncbi:MAG TPA: AAA family ATPase, partial [Phaeodactylibacter sp.]|nr:AAA family ATPase [Phaeodactylibacter sp.]
MIIINYPLLYFELKQDAVLGVLVGTEHQAIGKDLREVKSFLYDFLQKKYKKEGEYTEVGIEQPRLKIIDVKVRPRHKAQHDSYATGTDVKLSLSIVYGESGQGQYLCYLPMLNDYFYYHDARQLRTLALYFAIDHYNRLSPEQIYRQAQFSQPKMDNLSLRVKEDFDSNWNYRYDYPYKVLPKLAEKYPYPKVIRRNQSHFPEAAWELEEKVLDVADRIFNVRTNVLVVGNHGVGKSAVLKAAIRKISTQAKKQKIDISFWRIRAQRITASSKYLGEWQEAFEELIDELEEADGILWVEDVIQLLQTGGERPEDSVAAFMINFLQEGDFQVVGEATKQELESMRRFLPGFVECFQVVEIEELKENQVQSVMNQFADFCDKNLKIKITQDAIALTYRLLLRYYSYESFPGKAIRFFQECVHDAQVEERTEVQQIDIIKNFTTQTGLPELFLRDDLLLKKKELQGYFNTKIIGQPDAVKNLVDIVTVFKAGLNNPKKPISTMLFAGPTGVGKTQSAKALAEYFFGKGQKKNPLVRIDMSEFQHAGQIVQLIGGGNQVGRLVQEIR